MPPSFHYSRREEFSLSPEEHQVIGDLLRICFPEYPATRSYFKQVPSFRFLVQHEKQYIAHLGVEYRMMNIGGQVARVFGIIDLCVSENFQSQQIATTLLHQLEELALQHQIDFLVLATGEHDYYRKYGFQLVQNTCRWLMINEHQTLGVGHRRIEESLMVKALQKLQWNNGLIDFLGGVF